MYITNRDKEIMKFIEQYGSITINQCSNIFFRECKQKYLQSRKRLKQLSDNGFIQRYRKDMRSETVYYLTKRLSFHDIKVIDVYSHLIELGADIKTFKREYTIALTDKEYRIDGFIECRKDGYFYPIIVEIDYTHFTSYKKLMDIYNSRYFQEKYKELDTDIFPTIVITRPIISNLNKDLPFNLVFTDYNMLNLYDIFS